MTQYRTLNRKLLAKIESAPGVDAAPVVGTDAFVAIDPQMPGGPQTIDNSSEITGDLDVAAPIVGGGGQSFACSLRLKGSGAAGSAPPEFSPLLRACGLQVAALATAHTGTATAGTTSSLTLAAGASAVDGAYVGMPITPTSGAALGQTGVITAYNGTTKVATVFPNFSAVPGTPTYEIAANHIYRPRSSGLETVSIYDYVIRNSGDVRLRKLLGAVGNMSLSLVARDIPTASFQFTGRFGVPTDVVNPAAVVVQQTIPRPFMGARLGFGSATLLPKPTAIEINLGNNIVAADDPSDAFGIDAAGITRRQMTGSIVLPQELLSTRNVWADFLSGGEQRLFATWGNSAGNRVSIYCPRARYIGREDADVQGFMYERLPLGFMGGDSGFFMCFY
jgi:hypothetical protein